MTRKSFAALVFSALVLLPGVAAAAGPCLVPGSRCVVNVITGPTTVAINPNGTTFTIGTSNPGAFSLAGPVMIWVTPLTSPARGVLVTSETLCGPTGVRVPGIPNARQACMASNMGRSITVSIPSYIGDFLLQRGLPAPSGYWNLFVLQTNARPQLEAPLPHTIHFVPQGTPQPQPQPQPSAPSNATPSISSIRVIPGGNHPDCAAAGNTLLTVNVDGTGFDASAHIIVSYIYFVDHGTFRTDNNGRDSRVAANMQAQQPTFLQGTIDLMQIHRTGGDSYGPGGNYYVQVQNGNGKVNPKAPIYFTVPPYNGPDSHCR